MLHVGFSPTFVLRSCMGRVLKIVHAVFPLAEMESDDTRVKPESLRTTVRFFEAQQAELSHPEGVICFRERNFARDLYHSGWEYRKCHNTRESAPSIGYCDGSMQATSHLVILSPSIRPGSFPPSRAMPTQPSLKDLSPAELCSGDLRGPTTRP